LTSKLSSLRSSVADRRARPVARTGSLGSHVLDREAALPGELLGLLPGKPRVVLVECDVRAFASAIHTGP